MRQTVRRLLSHVPASDIWEEVMIQGLFGQGSITHDLRTGLDELSARHQGIADRVATALQASSSTPFADELQLAQAVAQEANIAEDMVALADNQLRYEADTRLLMEAYTRLRTAIRDRA